MVNLNGKNTSYLSYTSQIPFYHSSFSCSSNWSYLSSSSGFGSECQTEALDLSSDNDLTNATFLSNSISHQQNQPQQQLLNPIHQQINQDNVFNVGSTHSLDSLMDSEVFATESSNYTDMIPSNNESVFEESSFSYPRANSHLTNSLLTPLPCNNEFNQHIKGYFSNEIQMWQFLLELLEDKRFRNLIRWRSSEKNINDNEFVIFDPNEIVRRWAVRHSRPNMNYKKFCRIMRHYYKNKILQKTAGNFFLI